MPNVTLTIGAGEAARIQAALTATDYPATVAGFKQLLMDYTRSFVQEYERAKAEKDALASVVPVSSLVIT